MYYIIGFLLTIAWLIGVEFSDILDGLVHIAFVLGSIALLFSAMGIHKHVRFSRRRNGGGSREVRT